MKVCSMAGMSHVVAQRKEWQRPHMRLNAALDLMADFYGDT